MHSLARYQITQKMEKWKYAQIRLGTFKQKCEPLFMEIL